jgi:hypothetical protein
MHISLQAQAIVVHASQAFRRSKTVQEFLQTVAHESVFKSHFIQINATPSLHEYRLKFLHYMSKYTAKHKEIDASFLLKSTTRMQHYPIHIYIDTHYPKRIDVHVEALTQILRITHVLNTQVVYSFENSVLSTLFVSNADYFKILQCDINATPIELKQSFKRLAKVYHPDTVAHQNDPKKLAHYTQTFQALHEAYAKVAGAL